MWAVMADDVLKMCFVRVLALAVLTPCQPRKSPIQSRSLFPPSPSWIEARHRWCFEGQTSNVWGPCRVVPGLVPNTIARNSHLQHSRWPLPFSGIARASKQPSSSDRWQVLLLVSLEVSPLARRVWA
jgi:hypothetical protein